jgi:cobalt transporter subunit CbtB
MSSQTSSTAGRTAIAATRSSALLQALLAAALGMVLLFGVGFSHVEALHNAAHDTRHSAAFPCH